MREQVVVPGLTVSVVGLGCNNFGWRLDAPAARRSSTQAIEAGITLFDTAESYGDGESEEFLGRALAGRRDQVVIATKFGWGKGFGDNSIARGHPDYVRNAIEGSLQRLGTDYVDLYQYHRPDGVTPIAETLGAMDELVQAGQGALHRLLELLGGPGRGGGRGLGGARACPVRDRPEPLLLARAGRRGGAGPGPGASSGSP